MFKVAAVYILIYSLLSCSYTPLLSISENDIAIVLQPISKSNITDARAEFRQVYCAVNNDHGKTFPNYRNCNDALHKLSDEPHLNSPVSVPLEYKNKLHILLVPGIFIECLIDEVSPYSYAMEHLNKYQNINISIFPNIKGRASSLHNSRAIHEYLKSFEKKPDEKLIILAFSKGTADMLTYLDENKNASSYKKIDALVSIAGVVNGTPIADDTSDWFKAIIKNFPFDDCETQDTSGIEDLTREYAMAKLTRSYQPPHIKYFSLAAYAAEKNISTVFKSFHERLSLVSPRNDGQVLSFDAVLPNAILLGYANADHWAVAMPYSRNTQKFGLINSILSELADQNAYPREVLLEAIVRYVDSKL